MVMLFLVKLYRDNYEITANYSNLPLFILVCVIALSALFAKYKTVALFGLWDRHEGALTYCIYFALCFIAANVLPSQRQLKLLVFTLTPLIVLNAMTSVGAIYGHNVLQLQPFNSLLLGNASAGTIFITTLENPDYLSGFGAVCCALFTVKTLLAANWEDTAISLVFTTLAFAMILAATATSGFLTLIVLIPLFIALMWRSGNRKRSVINGVLILVCFSLVLSLLSQQNPTVWNKSFGFFGATTVSLESSLKAPAIRTSPQAASVAFSKTTGTQGAASRTGSPPPDDYASLPQPGMSAGTGRLYIWRKTIPMIKRHPLFGYGLDTLGYYFPQNDPVGIAEDFGQLQEKPHDMYLDIAFGAGLIALFALIYLFIRHFLANLVLLRHPIQSEQTVVLLSLFAGWCAYLIQGLFNDSVLSTAPLFWILFGFGISLLRHRPE